MQVQTLSFNSDFAVPVAAGRYLESVRLGIVDFPGLITAEIAATREPGVGFVLLWEDRDALNAFRHSELYAKLVLSPYWNEGHDCDFADAIPVPERVLDLATAA